LGLELIVLPGINMMPGLLLLMVEMLVELVLLPVSLLLLWMLGCFNCLWY
jgi:hypothetical protein